MGWGRVIIGGRGFEFLSYGKPAEKGGRINSYHPLILKTTVRENLISH